MLDVPEIVQGRHHEYVEKPIVVRSLKARLWTVGTWIVLGFAAIVCSSILQYKSSPLSPPWPVVIGVGGVVLFGAVRSFVRLAFVADQSGVAVHNPLRSYCAPWSEVEEVGVKYVGSMASVGTRIPRLFQGSTPPGVGVRLKTGRVFPAAVATAYLDADRRRWLRESIEELVRPLGVRVSLEPGDLTGF